MCTAPSPRPPPPHGRFLNLGRPGPQAAAAKRPGLFARRGRRLDTGRLARHLRLSGFSALRQTSPGRRDYGRAPHVDDDVSLDVRKSQWSRRFRGSTPQGAAKGSLRGGFCFGDVEGEGEAYPLAKRDLETRERFWRTAGRIDATSRSWAAAHHFRPAS